MNIRDRVKEFRRVPASQLQPNPKNWRTHPEAQANALRGILAEVGIAGAVLARETPEGGLMLIDGHLRAETLQNVEVPVLVLDVDEAEADKLLATIDPLGAMAEADADKLRELLEEVETASEDLANMFTELAEEAGIIEKDDDEPAVKQLDNRPPPKMAWALIAIPVVRFGEIAEQLEAIGRVDGVQMRTVANDQD
jgi:ParB-like chromosome segregation protein Spo0J